MTSTTKPEAVAMLTSWLWSLLATAARDTRDYIRFRQYKRRLR